MIVKCIYHISGLNTLGLQELWSRGSTGSTNRYIPVHVKTTAMGSFLNDKLPAMHCLPGNDAMSKFDTRLSGLKQLTIANLSDFGKNPQVNDTDDMLMEAERFFVTAIKPTNPLTSLD